VKAQTKKSTAPYKGIFNSLPAKYRLLIGLAAGLLVYLILRNTALSGLVQVMIGFDAFTIVLLTISWINFFTTPQHELRREAKVLDGSRILVFIVILGAALASMAAVGLILLNNDDDESTKAIRITAAVAGMLFSWMLVHTTFAYRYAHLYYADHHIKANADVEGLEFPDDDKPDFLDFAYFSFVLGMTFQVSDVEISEKKLRRLALAHGLISFFFNTTIIAITINILAGGRK
jgi:uncharacterized membrane protein